MPIGKVTLDDGTTSITINGPGASSSDYELLARTVSEQSANYDMRSYQLTSKKLRRWPLRFSDLTQAQKDNLVNFFTDDVIGPTNTFTYTHTDGKIYTVVRFVNDELQIERTSPTVFAVSVILEFDAQLVT